MNWMDQFLKQCLEGVPQGSYRTRLEKELWDHLLSLIRDLEGAGYPSKEARSLAQARMGNPAELAQSYVREWRRRAMKQQGLLTGNLLLLAMITAAVGLLYALNTRNFGKVWVADWGISAIVITQIMLHSSYFPRLRSITHVSCTAFSVIQLPPIFFWILCGGPFEFSGVLVPGWIGLSVHLLFFLWGATNCRRIQAERPPRIQSAE